MSINKRIFLGLGVTAAALAMTSPLAAQNAAASWPQKSITLVVGFAAGGSVDLIARIIGQGLEKKWGHPIIIINKPGAGGGTAAAEVATSAPDGYTVLVNPTSLLINGILRPADHQTLTQLSPVSITSVSTTVLVVPASSPAKTLKEFLELGKTQPLSIGTSAKGSAGNIVADYFFKTVAKSPISVIPYSQTAQRAVADMAGGHISAVALAGAEIAPHVRAGTARALAVTAAERSSILPDAPTMEEAGFPGVTAYGWTGMFLPAKTNSDVARKLNEAINEVLASADAKKRLDDLGFESNVMAYDRTQKFFNDQFETWKTMLATMKIEN